jgi:hypothetical protein
MQTVTRQQNSFSHNMREELDLEKRLLTNEVLSETDDQLVANQIGEAWENSSSLERNLQGCWAFTTNKQMRTQEDILKLKT